MWPKQTLDLSSKFKSVLDMSASFKESNNNNSNFSYITVHCACRETILCLNSDFKYHRCMKCSARSYIHILKTKLKMINQMKSYKIELQPNIIQYQRSVNVWMKWSELPSPIHLYNEHKVKTRERARAREMMNYRNATEATFV